MSDKSFDAEHYLDAAAAAIGLTIAPEHRPGVLANLQTVAAMAALVMDFPLSESAEAAPVFRP